MHAVGGALAAIRFRHGSPRRVNYPTRLRQSAEFRIATSYPARKLQGMNRLVKSVVAAFVALPLIGSPFAASLEARSGSDTALGSLVPRDDGFTAGAGVTHAFQAGLGNASGDLSITRFPVRLSYDLSGGAQGFLSLSALYEYSNYNWSELDAFNASHRVGLSGVGLRRFSDTDWGIFGFGQLGWGAEEGVSTFNRALSATVIAGPSYSLNRNFSVVVGGLASIQPEEDPRFLPVAAINWRINDEWMLRTLNGAILGWKPAEQDRYQFDLSAEYRTRGLRIRSIPGAPGANDPAVEEKEIAIGVGASVRLTNHLLLQTFAEYLFAREWEFRADDERVRTVDGNDTAQVGFRLDYRF